jgi:hypothetical protein
LSLASFLACVAPEVEQCAQASTLPDNFTVVHRDAIVAVAGSLSLPSIYSDRRADVLLPVHWRQVGNVPHLCCRGSVTIGRVICGQKRYAEWLWEFALAKRALGAHISPDTVGNPGNVG